MTHYSVLVIGPNVEDQLAPFDENRAVEPYRDYLDPSLLDRLKRWLRDEKKIPETTDAQVIDHLLEWRGGLDDGQHLPGKDDQGFYTWTTYNPDHRWDWYEIGGRWRGSLLLKSGACGRLGDPGVPEAMAIARGDLDPAAVAKKYRGTADQARKGDVNFEAMERAGRRLGRKEYDLLLEVTAGLKPPRRCFFERLQRRAGRRGLSLRSPLPKDFLDSVRKSYRSHPWVRAIEEHDQRERERMLKDRSYEPRLLCGFLGGDPVASFLVHRGGRRAFIERRGVNEAYPFSALLEDGLWQSDMPYYGMFAALYASDDDGLATKIRARLRDLPDDTLLTVVDCHT